MKLSSLSEGEAFLITANWEILCEKKYRCEACLSSTIEAQRALKGCKGGVKYRLAEYVSNGCIGNHYSPAVFFWYRLYEAFKKGTLPDAGGLLDQSAKWLEIFQVFQNLEAEAEAKARKDADKRARQDGRK